MSMFQFGHDGALQIKLSGETHVSVQLALLSKTKSPGILISQTELVPTAIKQFAYDIENSLDSSIICARTNTVLKVIDDQLIIEPPLCKIKIMLNTFSRKSLADAMIEYFNMRIDLPEIIDVRKLSIRTDYSWKDIISPSTSDLSVNDSDRFTCSSPSVSDSQLQSKPINYSPQLVSASASSSPARWAFGRQKKTQLPML